MTFDDVLVLDCSQLSGMRKVVDQKRSVSSLDQFRNQVERDRLAAIEKDGRPQSSMVSNSHPFLRK
jgi:hypothetical protein